VWFGILSDLFVNIAAAWFAVVFVEVQVSSFQTGENVLVLLLKLLVGILSLFLAKYLREKAGRFR